MKHAVKARAQRLLEGEDIVVEPIHRSMVSPAAQMNMTPSLCYMSPRPGLQPKTLPDDVYID